MPTVRDRPKSSIPDYFRTLDEFRTYLTSTRIPNLHASKPINYLPPIPSNTNELKLVTCHDYKGGYSESNSSRGYTYNWNHITDTLIYFAHHRISTPPSDWIRSCHRQGTKILGTIIFENNGDPTSSDSILSLILGEHLQSCHDHVDSLVQVFDTTLADALVDLAIERGFEGWLVNIEVPLGIRVDGKMKAGSECGQVLKNWLEYLTIETERRIVGGEIMWYDGVTIEGLSNNWQNRLSPSNLPFFNVSSSIFLNYFWGMDHLKDTINRVDKSTRSRNEVAVGLDVWGRNQYGGGGFDCWRALDFIVEASEKKPSSDVALSSSSLVALNNSSTTSSLSLALFAPGWSIESDNLKHSISTKEGYKKWWEDESYLWNGGEETINAKKEKIRKEKEEREKRGILRARDLARMLSNGVDRVVPIPTFDYNSNLPVISGAFRSITSYFKSPRAPPVPHSTFYTNFSNGSGHDFYFNGKKVLSSEAGYTDMDFSYPPPSLFYFLPTAGVELSLHEDDAWIGSVSLNIRASLTSNSLAIPLCPTSLSIPPNIIGAAYKVVVVWKSVEGSKSVGFHFGDPRINVFGATTLDLDSGWVSTSAFITTSTIQSLSIPISSFGIQLASSSSSIPQPISILVGSLSLSPAYNIFLPQPLVSNFHFNETTKSLTWDSIHSSPVPTSLSLPNIADPPRLAQWPSFEFYALFELGSDGEKRNFIGTTSSTEMNLIGYRSGRIIVIGVKRDGEVVEAIIIDPSLLNE